ncbi:MAG: class I SAM-dependent methyltransferase [Gammaproteobacteria bacterium]|nr:class I SAM-dependent methyltransferase [Gammaproteobacteria bacterium]
MTDELENTAPHLLTHIPLEKPRSQHAQRLFHGRGHAYQGYEHVSIDWLAPVVLITLYKAVDTVDLQHLAEKLFSDIADCRSVQVQHRYQQRTPFELLLGEECAETVVEENGLKYQITLGRAQNTGLFLDMKNGRQWVQEHSHNAKVLNLFSYTCAFSVAALAGGAKQVFNIDMSRVSLTTGRDNHRLNDQDTKKVKFEAIDIFKSFGRIKKHGPYDLLICDPPSFQKGSVDIRRDYKKIIRRIPEFMNSGSLLMLCLNSPDLDTEFLKQTVVDECPACQYLSEITAPEVFVEAMEGKGLKVLIYKYLC